VNVDTTQLGHQPVCDARWETAQPEVVNALLAPAANDVVALSNLLEEGRDIGRVMLQIAVHRNDVLAARMVKAGRQPSGLPEVAAQLHDGDAAVDGRNLPQ